MYQCFHYSFFYLIDKIQGGTIVKLSFHKNIYYQTLFQYCKNFFRF
jgi:hypothetical protein